MDVDDRIRAARPPLAGAEPDPQLLAQVMAQPVARRRRRPVAIPAVAVVTLAVAAFVVLGGNRPDTASALDQAMRWFNPPAGTVLHSVMVDDTGNTHEFWQDVDDFERSRVIEPGGYETGAGAIYDPAANTIYTDTGTRTPGKGPDPKADAVKRAKLAREGAPVRAREAEAEPAGAGRVKPREIVPTGDPLITKVRVLIADGRAAVRGREVHNGTDAWKITLTDTADREPWVLWVRADDGKPLAIDDPGNPARDKAPEHSRWTTYEVLGDAPITLREAHPDAKVVNDPAQYEALLQRMKSR
jgi:hypothetical protein